MGIGKGLTGTQVTSSKGRAASGVVKQSDGCCDRSRMEPVMGAQLPGRGLGNTQTRNSRGTNNHHKQGR